jgi:hypothetical protein
MSKVKVVFALLKETFKEWDEDCAPRLAVALSYSHPCAAGAQKSDEPEDQALGRSRGGFSTKIHVMVDALSRTGNTYHNLDVALEIIAKIRLLYNSLQRSDQKALLRQVVEQVIVNNEKKIRLELMSPFAYLQDLTSEIRNMNPYEGEKSEIKTSEECSTYFQEQYSNWLHVCWGTWIRTKINRFRACGSAVELSPNNGS